MFLILTFKLVYPGQLYEKNKEDSYYGKTFQHCCYGEITGSDFLTKEPYPSSC